jgi:ribosomal protein L14E/L6E/L27E
MLGMITYSKRGHDKGKVFVIIRVVNDYCYLVDGKSRLCSTPKKKKLKHLQITNYICHDLVVKINNNTYVDLDFVNAINTYKRGA